ncbi:MAG: hypothetical protein IPG59_11940 [Candidatus Melainabacteria bacterium]|nr:MAG: hypothetical protein IPG59_11940 [Candidatus Melainabacteria bacterium]
MKKIVPLHLALASWLIFSACGSLCAQENPPVTSDINADPVPNPESLQPGAGLAMRQTLAKQIVEAQKRGVGVKAYSTAFAQLEDSVAKGATEDDVKKKVLSIVSGLHSQLRQSATLKSTAAVSARQAAAGKVDRRGAVLKTRSDGFLYAGDNENIFMKDKGVMRQQSQLDMVETIIRQKLREHPIQGIDPNDPRPLRDDPRVKKLIH